MCVKKHLEWFLACSKHYVSVSGQHGGGGDEGDNGDDDDLEARH